MWSTTGSDSSSSCSSNCSSPAALHDNSSLIKCSGCDPDIAISCEGATKTNHYHHQPRPSSERTSWGWRHGSHNLWCTQVLLHPGGNARSPAHFTVATAESRPAPILVGGHWTHERPPPLHRRTLKPRFQLSIRIVTAH